MKNIESPKAQIFPLKIIDEDNGVISVFSLRYLISPFRCHFTNVANVEHFYIEHALYDRVWFSFSLVFTCFWAVGGNGWRQNLRTAHCGWDEGTQRRGNGISITSFNFTTASIATSTSWTMRDCWSDDAVPWVPARVNAISCLIAEFPRVSTR